MFKCGKCGNSDLWTYGKADIRTVCRICHESDRRLRRERQKVYLPDTHIGLKEAEAISGYSRSSLWRWVKKGRFPRPEEIGHRIAWRKDDIKAWAAKYSKDYHPNRVKKAYESEAEYVRAKKKSMLERGIVKGECLEWARGLSPSGYGLIGHDGKRSARVHRVMWELTYGAIPKDKVICHRCDNRKCFRIDHLFLASQAENMRDAKEKGRMRGRVKTHCKRGHELIAENTYKIRVGDKFVRQCRLCYGIRSKKYYRKKRESQCSSISSE